jgi:hypothetical protein
MGLEDVVHDCVEVWGRIDVLTKCCHTNLLPSSRGANKTLTSCAHFTFKAEATRNKDRMARGYLGRRLDSE